MPLKFKLKGSGNFIEFGDLKGDGIKAALSSGFSRVYSIGTGNRWFAHCSDRFKEEIGSGKVILILGEPLPELKALAKKLTEPSTFWLCVQPRTANPEVENSLRPNRLIIEELKAIATSPNKEHHILVDGIRLLNQFQRPGGNSTTVESVLDAARMINKDYHCAFQPGTKRKAVMDLSVNKDAIDDFAFLAVISSNETSRQEALKSAQQLGLQDSELSLILAKTAKREGNRELAISLLREAMDQAPFDPTILEGAGIQLKDLRAVDLSIDVFQKLIAIDGKSPRQYLFLAEALLQKKKYLQAQALARVALDLRGTANTRILSCLDEASMGKYGGQQKPSAFGRIIPCGQDELNIVHMASFSRSGETLMLRALSTHPEIGVVHQIREPDHPDDIKLFHYLREYHELTIGKKHPMLRHRNDLADKKILILKNAVWEHPVKANGFILARNPMSVIKSTLGFKETDDIRALHSNQIRRWSRGIDSKMIPHIARIGAPEAFSLLLSRKMTELFRTNLPIVRYEDFVCFPELILKKLCEHFSIKWSDNMLNSHKFFKKGEKGHGGIDLSSEINEKSLQKYLTLTIREKAQIYSQCYPVFTNFQYFFDGEKVSLNGNPSDLFNRS